MDTPAGCIDIKRLVIAVRQSGVEFGQCHFRLVQIGMGQTFPKSRVTYIWSQCDRLSVPVDRNSVILLPEFLIGLYYKIACTFLVPSILRLGVLNERETGKDENRRKD